MNCERCTAYLWTDIEEDHHLCRYCLLELHGSGYIEIDDHGDYELKGGEPRA